MGSFIGHAIPGSFFLLFGIWWVFRIYIAYYRSLSDRRQRFKSYVTFSPHISRFPRLNLEALVCCFVAAIGIFVEIIAACILRHSEIAIGNQQHATMYFFFGLSGFVTLIIPRINFVACYGNVEYTFLALAFFAEAMLFKFHLMGRGDLDVLVHVMLLYTVYANFVAVLLEAKFRHSILAAIIRAFCTIVQGTWFWQLGFILYNPLGSSWKLPEGKEGHHLLMKAVLIFAWHLAIVFICILVVGVAIGKWYQRKGHLAQYHELHSDHVLMHERNDSNVSGAKSKDALLSEHSEQDSQDEL